MAGRSTYHGKIARKEHKEKKAPPKKKVAAVIGRPYTIEELQKLIAALADEDTEVGMEGVAQFAENQSRISAGAAKAPDISETSIVEQVIAVVLKNQNKMLKKFEKERREKALRFVAESSSVPPRVRDRAAAILRRLGIGKVEKKPEVPLVQKEVYTPQQVRSLLSNLKSRVKETRIAAAIEFIRNYARIAPTVSKMPMLTVTAVTEKALKVINENPDLVLNTLVQKKMLKELEFLSSLSQLPLPLREHAKKAAEKLSAQIPKPIVHEEKPVVVREKASTLPTPKQYTPLQLEALLSGLDSVERVRATKFAVEFLKNYSIIADAVSKAPLLTVTDVTKKAVKVIETNLNDVLKELEKGKEMDALHFLAESSKFSDETRKRARVVLKILLKPFDET